MPSYHPSGRRWVKLWVQEWLEGSTRFELTIEQRAIFIDLLALAGKSRIPGTVCSGLTDDGKPRPYPLSWLAGNMICTEAMLQTALDRCRDTGKLSYEMQPWDGAICCLITLTNWTRYQSEYERQKKYRQSLKSKGDTQSYTADCPKVTRPITPQEEEEEEEEEAPPLSSLRSDNGQQPTGVAALKRASKPVKRRREPKLDPDTLQSCKEIETWLEHQRGYVSPCFAAERKAIAWMLAHDSTPAHIRDCYFHLQESERWLKGKLLRMTYVQQQIGAWRNGGSADPGPPP